MLFAFKVEKDSALQKLCFVEDGSVIYKMKIKHFLKYFTEAVPKTTMEKKKRQTKASREK